MANFIIDINEEALTPMVYTPHVGFDSIVFCPGDEPPVTYDIRILSSDRAVFSMLDTYSGNSWKYLTITSVQIDFFDTTSILYNGSAITYEDLPLKIDVEAVSPINNIPLLEVQFLHPVSNTKGNQVINVSFYMEDIEGQKGETVLASFQRKLYPCVTPPTAETPVITSALSHTIDTSDPDNYIFEYWIQADGEVTSYDAIGLPTSNIPDVTYFNHVTGYLRILCQHLDDRYLEKVYTFDIKATNINAFPFSDLETFTLTIPPQFIT